MSDSSSTDPKPKGQQWPRDSIHYIDPDGSLPPWYRPPPGEDTGSRAVWNTIIAGLIVSNEEGRRWFSEKFGIELADHGRQDANITLRLRPIFREKQIPYQCRWVPRRLDTRDDIMIITQCLQGQWEHIGPINYSEVTEEDRKPIEGQAEQELRKRLLDEVGTCYPLPRVSCINVLDYRYQRVWL